MDPYRTSSEVLKKHFEDVRRDRTAEELSSMTPDYPLLVDRAEKFGDEIEDMVCRTHEGLKVGMKPELTKEGLGGNYFLKDSSENKVSVFKPLDEERKAKNNPRLGELGQPGGFSKTGIDPGTGSAREIAAYYLDHPEKVPRREGLTGEINGFAGVPPTLLAWCLSPEFNYPQTYAYAIENYKKGSLQMFVKNEGTCQDRGPAGLSTDDVHKISVLDIRLANTDRNEGNMLVHEKEEEGANVLGLIPIDHGGCFPKNFDGGCMFEWLNWKQADEPYSPQVISYINSIDAEQDIALMRRYKFTFSDEYANVLRISAMLLKKGVKRGLTAHKIGKLMCIENPITEKSVIKEIVDQAIDALLPETGETFLEIVSKIMDSRLQLVI